MASHPSALQRLLGELPAADFVQQYYLRLPFESSQGTAAALLPAPLTAFGAEFFGGTDRDVIVGRQGELRTTPGLLTSDAIQSYLAEGYTIGLRQAHRHDANLSALARSFEHDLGGKVDIHLYWTPAGEPGFGWHYDAEEVFVLQLAGSKTWSLRKNTVNPWPLMEAIPPNQQYEREIMPIRQHHLIAGGWLYIPGGYWHATVAGEQSMSMSIGVRAPIAMDLLDHARALLMQSIEWRERLPCVGAASHQSPDEIDAAHTEIIERLCLSFATTLQSDLFRKSLIARGHANEKAGSLK